MFDLGSTLDENSKADKPWTKHRRNNVKVSEIYDDAGEYQFRRYAERMRDCGFWLEFAEIKSVEAVKEHDGKLKLTKTQFCRVRHCPICAWRRTLALLARFHKHLPEYLKEYPDYAYLYVVLTVKNPRMDQLRETIQVMNDACHKLRKRKDFEAVCKGFVKTIEVTRGQDGNPHPHINLCIAVNKSYFTDRTYLSQARWVELWKDCLKVDYDPVVHIKKITKRKKKDDDPGESSSSDLIAGMKEVIKYSIKEEDLVEDPDFLIGLTKQVARLRFVSTGGCFKGILNKIVSDSEEVEDVDENEMLLRDDEAKEKITEWRQKYAWGYADSRHGQYYLTARYQALPKDDPQDDE